MAFATSDFTTPQTEVHSEKRPGIFARMYKALVDARMREAERKVTAYLLTMDDRTLADLGYDRAKLVKKDAGYRL